MISTIEQSIYKNICHPIDRQVGQANQWLCQLPDQLRVSDTIEKTQAVFGNVSKNLETGSKIFLFNRLPEVDVPLLQEKAKRVDKMIDRVDKLLNWLPEDIDRTADALHRSRLPAALLLGMLFGWVFSTIRGGQWLFLPITAGLATWTAWRYRDLSWKPLLDNMKVQYVKHNTPGSK